MARSIAAARVGAGCKRGCSLQACCAGGKHVMVAAGAGCKRGCWLQAWVLAATTLCWIREKLLELHSFENTRLCTRLGCVSCWLQAWVLEASVSAGCKCGCWLQPWVLAASVGAGCKRVMLAASMSWWLRAWVLAATVGAGCKREC